MEAKLIKDRLFLRKVVDSYVLHRIKDSILTIEGDSQYTIGGIEPFYKLSLKNCQAIELGYDLDELATDHAEKITEETDASSYNELCDAYESGFQKCLEILGDKKCSEEDMINFAEYCKGDLMKTKDLFNEYQSLQQTEWDCVIFVDEKTKLPLLDNEGNLILKRR